MTDTAPERIGLLSDGMGRWALATVDEAAAAVQYVRADLHEAEIKEAREIAAMLLGQIKKDVEKSP